jgi:hypothetical protein
MASPCTHEFTQWVQAWGEREKCALENSTPLVYDELRRAAREIEQSTAA